MDGKGWEAARAVIAGDWLSDSNGYRVGVLSNEAVKRSTKVYTFSLSGDNAFYANGILAHDLCGAPPVVTSINTSEVVK